MHAHKKKYITKALNILICFIALPLKAVFTACLVHILCFIMFMCNNDVYAIWSFSQHEGIPKSFSLLWSDIREDFTPSLKKKKKIITTYLLQSVYNLHITNYLQFAN